MALNHRERLAIAGMAVCTAIEEGGTDAKVLQAAITEARKQYRAILRASADGRDYLAESEEAAVDAAIAAEGATVPETCSCGTDGRPHCDCTDTCKCAGG